MLVHLPEHTGIDGVGNVHHALSGQQCTLARLASQPLTASHEADMLTTQHTLLGTPHAIGQSAAVVGGQQRTGPALVVELFAATGVMTDGRGRPQVVHRPYYRLARQQDAPYVLQRQHALVHPVQMDDVGFLKFGQTRDVGAAVGDVHLKHTGILEMHVQPDDQPLPKEMPLRPPPSGHATDRQPVGFLLTHQHAGLHPVITQRLHQPVGCHGSTAGALTGIDNQNFHTLFIYAMQRYE